MLKPRDCLPDDELAKSLLSKTCIECSFSHGTAPTGTFGKRILVCYMKLLNINADDVVCFSFYEDVEKSKLEKEKFMGV